MPTAETLARFIARVEQNAHVEAIAEFYTADASMQENNASPRRGREALVAQVQGGIVTNELIYRLRDEVEI